jgi:hypothetical protein
MKIHFDDIETVNDVNDGSWGTFYYKNEKFNGIVYDTIDDLPYWIFSVKDGLQHGVEYTYYEGTDILEQICEYRNNFQYGISKEYDEIGNLSSISVILDNDILRIIEIDELGIEESRKDAGKYGTRLPDDIALLLNLSIEDLIDYSFLDIE